MTAVLVALLAFSYVSSTMCWHTHTIGGKTLVHSHLLGRGDPARGSDGSHTPGQLLMIQEANDVTCTDDVIPEFHLERIEILTDIFFAPAVRALCGLPESGLSLRAPPVL